jgi:hypothetical protein
MGILALAADERVADVEVAEDELSVRLMDGRTISVPLVWYPRLLNATEPQRKNWQIIGGGYGIHWEAVDEDLSTEGLLRGAPAPRQSFGKAISFTQQHESRISAETIGDERVTAVEISEDDAEKGVLDHLTEREEAEAELISVITWIRTETESIGEKINRHTAHLNQLISKPGGTKASNYKKIILLAASDMNTFSKRVEGVLSNFEKSVRVLDESYYAYVSVAKPESDQDVEQILNLRNSLSQILSVVRPVKESVMGFRDSTLSIKNQNINKEISKAATRQSQALEGVVSNIVHLESFALRVIFLIDEKFEGRFTSEDTAD